MSGVACFIAGWVTCAVVVALGLGALIAWADAHDSAASPTTVLDPETGALWTETRRVDTYA